MQSPIPPIPTKRLVRQANVISNQNYIRLPLCDILFCIFSLLLHIITLLSVVTAAFYLKSFDYFISFYILISILISATLTVSITSFIWYLQNTNNAFNRIDLGLHVAVHLLQLTNVWRHYLFFRRLPEHATKFIFCEFLILRLLNAALFSLPCCLVLFFILFRHTDNISEIENALLIASILTLTDFCWSLASFNRRTKRNEPEYLILSWPSILCQFLWRLGTVGSRCIILTIYASNFLYLTSIVLGLHWILMFLALFMFTHPIDTNAPQWKWAINCIWMGFVYIFCFYNPSKDDIKWRCGAFYLVMFAENSLLLIIWLTLAKVPENWIRSFAIGTGWGGFIFGCVMMIIYYKYLHVTKLKAAFNEKRSSSEDGPGNQRNTQGPFVCKLPTLASNFRTATNAHHVSKRDLFPIDGNQAQPSVAWPRNGRRCRSTPNDRRYRRPGSSMVTEIQEGVQNCRNGSRSLPRRGGRSSSFPNDNSAHGHDLPIENEVSQSKFIETIF